MQGTARLHSTIPAAGLDGQDVSAPRVADAAHRGEVPRSSEVRRLRSFVTRNAEGDRSGLLGGATPATVVVMGAQRSGTTMTAGLLQILGVEFGDDVADRGEDIALTRCIQRMHHGLAFWRIFSVRREFGRILRERRRAWKPFGFKSPFLAPILWFMGDRIPHPVYILTMRNPLAAAVSGEHWGGSAWTSAFVRATFYQWLYARFAARTRRPILICAFEDSVRAPEALLEELARFLGVEVTPAMREQAQGFVQPQVGYRTTRRLQGWVETLSPERAVGWVADLTDPMRILTVEISLDGTVLAREPAEAMREDVAEAGHHASGYCGFEIAFPRSLSPAEMRRVRIYIPELNHTLRFGLDGQIRSLYLPGGGDSTPPAAQTSQRR